MADDPVPAQGPYVVIGDGHEIVEAIGHLRTELIVNRENDAVKAATDRDTQLLNEVCGSIRKCDGLMNNEIRDWIDSIELIVPLLNGIHGGTIRVAA